MLNIDLPSAINDSQLETHSIERHNSTKVLEKYNVPRRKTTLALSQYEKSSLSPQKYIRQIRNNFYAKGPTSVFKNYPSLALSIFGTESNIIGSFSQPESPNYDDQEKYFHKVPKLVRNSEGPTIQIKDEAQSRMLQNASPTFTQRTFRIRRTSMPVTKTEKKISPAKIRLNKIKVSLSKLMKNCSTIERSNKYSKHLLYKHADILQKGIEKTQLTFSINDRDMYFLLISTKAYVD